MDSCHDGLLLLQLIVIVIFLQVMYIVPVAKHIGSNNNFNTVYIWCIYTHFGLVHQHNSQSSIENTSASEALTVRK